jgi:hypothetical protein
MRLGTSFKFKGLFPRGSNWEEEWQVQGMVVGNSEFWLTWNPIHLYHLRAMV